MSSTIKPIKVYGKAGPNPLKVAIVLEELQIPYENVPMDLSDVKKPDFLVVNPNGRVPAIYDPNTDLTLWESGAIVEYLIERYDTSHRLSFSPGSADSYLAKQWLFFQTTGQGPYYGQAIWFKKYHPEQLPSAIDRYLKEIHRVCGVLEGHLAKQSKGANGDGLWLVGGNFSYADIAFVPWQVTVGRFLGKDEYNIEDFPHVKEWLDKMNARESIEKVTAAAFHK